MFSRYSSHVNRQSKLPMSWVAQMVFSILQIIYQQVTQGSKVIQAPDTTFFFFLSSIKLKVLLNLLFFFWLFQRLKSIRLSKPLKLTETPVFTDVLVLEKLVLEDCLNLSRLHPSIGVHNNLTLLSLNGCKNLKTLPNKFEMKAVKT